MLSGKRTMPSWWLIKRLMVIVTYLLRMVLIAWVVGVMANGNVAAAYPRSASLSLMH
jgi:hypothetical protein